MRPEHLNLRDGEPPLAVCPDCDTWHRLTRSMIKPHRASIDAPRTGERRYYGDKPTGGPRCPGSAQRITIDITVEEWGEKLLAADSTATGRRSARQHHKPIQTPATPVARMARPAPNAAAVLDAYREHLKQCRPKCRCRKKCPKECRKIKQVAGRCGATYRCITGLRLAAQYELLSRGQEQRDRVNMNEARVDTLIARHRSSVAAQRTAAEWARHRDDTTAPAAALAKRSGTAVEDANNMCRTRRAGTLSDYRGPQVPREPVHITAA
ncbi:hypothetical protein [Streptomyces sp. E2N166]|uniref:hypothetical protein n=1 Tax=Streptomyces sp. E2N166 TaxID=1851909 RepID=UPI001EE78537|nr:hypothetical protein [Streptomyces sp. E2N166]